VTIIDERPEVVAEPPEYPVRATGILGWVTTTDHKRIGVAYMVTGFVFFFIGGAMAELMRMQLAQPDQDLISEDRYNQLFTMHGTIMLLLFVSPFALGLANYFVPLQIGAKDMAFPRLNALGYWLTLFAGIVMLGGFATKDGAAKFGWYGYTPLSDGVRSPNVGGDLWIVGIALLGVAGIITALNVIATVSTMRAPGMTMFRMPIFTWNIFVTSLLILMTFPVLTAAGVMLFFDRQFDARIFDANHGGYPLLWQHLFWFFGHPEVYILVLPFFGVFTEIFAVFARRPVFGYKTLVFATLAIGFLSVGVWAHHMFTTGAVLLPFFSFMTMLIAVPTGVKFFNWIGTMWGGQLNVKQPLVWGIGFLLTFLLGGLTGPMLASAPLDFHLSDSYFVVAHFHYVLNGAVVFPIFGALYFWLPKMTGRMLDERLGKISFWTMFVGFNVTFFPMHILGFLGMPRRVYTYDSGLGWDGLNLLISIASFFFALGTLLTLANFVWSQFRGARAPADPWHGDSLEWSTTSPPPEYNFAAMPVVTGRHPLWDEPPATIQVTADEPATRALGVVGALDKQMPVTEGLDAHPQDVLGIPAPTYLPFIAAVGIALLFVGFLVEAALIGVVGVLIGATAVVHWLWRTSEELR
jgi:cytochrome c oxidase subunit 1